MSFEFRGSNPTGWFMIGEGSLAALLAVLFAGFGLQHAIVYSSSGDESGVGALVIVIGFVIALALAAYAPLAILAGRAVRRGSHPAWMAALALSALQVVITPFVWPLAIPVGLLGVVALLLLLLPETRAECAGPPADAETESGALEEPETADAGV